MEFDETQASNDSKTSAEDIDAGEGHSLSFDARLVRAKVRSRLFGGPKQAAAIGSYRVLDRLGAGGMGVVYSAFDEELERKVALKIMGRAGDERARVRMRREAKALARLSHPNVVAVHEVGEHETQVFVAMEFVDGENLACWAEKERATEEVLAVYLQAAEGLWAAHEAGLVHRDFKPANAILGKDGRVRVLDFGLASASLDTTSQDEEEGGGGDGPADARLTATGTIMGTPAYMAPEQHEGRPASPASDQFALSVALWEALFGQRPFPGGTRAEVFASIKRGKLQPQSAAKGVPAALREVLVRGLSIDPDERFGDLREWMREVKAVQNSTRRRRWPLALAAGLAVSLGAGGMAFSAALGDSEQGEAAAAGEANLCRPAQEWIDMVLTDELESWWPTQAAKYEAQPFVERAILQGESELRGILRAWGEAYEASCAIAASPEAAERSIELRRVQCLEVGIQDLASQMAAAATVPDARTTATWMPQRGYLGMNNCFNDTYLRHIPLRVFEPGENLDYDRAWSNLERAEEMRMAGAIAPSRLLARQAMSIAKDTGDEALLARAMIVHALAGTLEERGANLQEVLRVANRAGSDDVSLWALQELVWLAEPGSEERAALITRVNDLSERLGTPFETMVFNLRERRQAARSSGDKEAAVQAAREALAKWEAFHFPLPTAHEADFVGSAHLQLGRTLADAGDYEAAVSSMTAAVDNYASRYGGDNPFVLRIRMTRAESMARAGHPGIDEELEEILRQSRIAYPEGARLVGEALETRGRVRRLRYGRDPLATWQAAEAELRGTGARPWDPEVRVRSELVLTQVRRGEAARAKAWLESYDSEPTGAYLDELAQALMQARAGDVEGALERFAPLVAGADDEEQYPGHVAYERALWNAEMYVEANDSSKATELAGALEASIAEGLPPEPGFRPLARARLEYLLGWCQLATGDTKAALTNLKASVDWLDAHEKVGDFAYFEPRARLTYARALANSGATEAAKAQLAKARPQLEALGPDYDHHKREASELAARL